MVSCQTFFLEIAEIVWQSISVVSNTELAKAVFFFLCVCFFWMACISMIMYKVTLWLVFSLCWDNVVC